MNRSTYKEITKTYDFLDQLDEIARYVIGENDPVTSDPNGTSK